MTEEERCGLFQFLYIVACGSVEAVLTEYLTSVIQRPKATLRGTKVFPPHSNKFSDGIAVAMDSDLMSAAVYRLLERTTLELASAPFGRLIDLHFTILGTRPTETMSASLYAGINGLVAIRNVIAHSRSVYVDLVRDPTGSSNLLPESNFDSNPLKPAFQALAQANLYSPEAAKTNHGVVGLLKHLYREEVLLYFWNAAADATDIYLKLAAAGGFLDEKSFDRLPRIAA